MSNRVGKTFIFRTSKEFADFLNKIKDQNGHLKAHLIEVKTTKDLRPPVAGKGKKR